MKSQESKSLWLYNITKNDVSIGDLYATVPAFSGIDLLRVTGVTEEKIKRSIESGSLFKRRHILKFGGTPPKKEKKFIEVSNLIMERPFKGGIEVKPEVFDDSFLDQQNSDELKYVEELLASEDEDSWKSKK